MKEINSKQKIQQDWIKAKEERERLEKIVDEGDLPLSQKTITLFARAVEREKMLYKELTGKTDPLQKKPLK